MLQSRRARRLGILPVLFLVLAAACSKSSPVAEPTPTGSGPVRVLYPTALTSLMTTQVGPAFSGVTGYQLVGVPGTSASQATAVRSGRANADVFISSSPALNVSLESAAAGKWVSWYAQFAFTRLVLGYNVSSTFAAALKSQPWYKVVIQPGFRLGRPDPKTDTTGALSVLAVSQTATAQNLPALAAINASTSNLNPQKLLAAEVLAGGLDAAFLSANEAKVAGIPTVLLTGPAVSASTTYTLTIVNKAPDQAGALAFARFLLGRVGQGFLTTDGFTPIKPPTVTGTSVPTPLSGVFAK